MSIRLKMDRWVLENYGKKFVPVPRCVDFRDNIFWKIGGQCYGPILITEIPAEIRRDMCTECNHGFYEETDRRSSGNPDAGFFEAYITYTCDNCGDSYEKDVS